MVKTPKKMLFGYVYIYIYDVHMYIHIRCIYMCILYLPHQDLLSEEESASKLFHT